MAKTPLAAFTQNASLGQGDDVLYLRRHAKFEVRSGQVAKGNHKVATERVMCEICFMGHLAHIMQW